METVENPKIESLLLENAQLKAQQEVFKNQLEHYREAYSTLQQQVQDLLRHRFGQRSERFVDPSHPQLSLFEKESVPPSPSADEEDQKVAAHQRRKKKPKDTSLYPRVIEIIPVSDTQKQCPCGGEKIVIRHETKALYDYKPAVLRIIEQRREVVACPKGCEQSIQTAAAPGHVLPKVKATESLLAHVVVSKCHDRQPLYHLEKYARAIDMSRETMARWTIQLVAPLQPLFNLMKDELIEYDIASIDATSLQVLREPGRAAKTKSYVYCSRGGPPDKSVILYGYNAEKHKLFVDDWLEGFKGSIHMDADSFFETLLQDPEVDASFCNAHARRYFEKVKQQAKKQGLAHEALRFYKKLYGIERQAKKEQLSAKARHALRQRETRPIWEEFKAWLDAHQSQVLEQSPLGKAFRYTLKYWEGLSRFLEEGRLEIDNNLTEQEIKPFVIARKNFLFASSVEGARALCMHFSLIRTALLHHLDPYQYYTEILKGLPSCQTAEDYEALLPWNIKLE